MKRFFSLALLLLPFYFFSQTRLPLSFKTDDKTTVHGFPYWQEVHVSSKDTSFTTRIHKGNPDVINNLKTGTYKLTFFSLFHHCVTKKVQLNKKTPLVKVKLQSVYTRVSDVDMLTSKLKLSDTLFILFSSNADENAKEKLAITKTKEGYKAIQYEGIGDRIFQQMIFKDEFYKDVMKFEKDGRAQNSPKAESAPKAEMYTIELNKQYCSFIVPGEWGGMNSLKTKLFIVEKK